MQPIIGIDLGTTNSAVACLTDNGPTLIANALGTFLTPSVVGLDDSGKLVVGAAAKELQVVKPQQCACLFKRHMGSEWTVKLGKKTFNPEELSSLILRSLKADAEAYFHCDVAKAVITVPAYFNDRQRKATIAAGKIAGLDVQRILNEPTAAAIAYGYHEAKEDKTLLIFDLGGGTFDVSIVEFFEGTLEVKASSGEDEKEEKEEENLSGFSQFIYRCLRFTSIILVVSLVIILAASLFIKPGMSEKEKNLRILLDQHQKYLDEDKQQKRFNDIDIDIERLRFRKGNPAEKSNSDVRGDLP